MNLRSTRNLLAALLQWMWRLVRRSGPNQGHTPDEHASGLPESPREVWMRKYKTSSPPEDWLQRVAAASENASAQIPAPGRKVVRKRQQAKEAALAEASSEKTGSRVLPEKLPEQDSKLAGAAGRPASSAPSAPEPQRSRAETAQTNESLAGSRPNRTKIGASQIQEDDRVCSPGKPCATQQAAIPDSVLRVLHAESNDGVLQHKKDRAPSGVSVAAVSSRYHPASEKGMPEDDRQRVLSKPRPKGISAAAVSFPYRPVFEKETPPDDQQQVPLRLRSKKMESLPVSPVFKKPKIIEGPDNSAGLARRAVPPVLPPENTLGFSHIDRRGPLDHISPSRHSEKQGNSFGAANFAGELAAPGDESETAIQSVTNLGWEIEEPWPEPQGPWPELPPLAQGEFPALQRALLLQREQDRAVHEQRGGW